MANTYGALKRVRQAERRTAFNRFAKTRLRHQIRSMRQALAAKQPGNLNEVMAATFSLVDKAARKGIIHPNKAARKTARLARAAYSPGLAVARAAGLCRHQRTIRVAKPAGYMPPASGAWINRVVVN